MLHSILQLSHNALDRERSSGKTVTGHEQLFALWTIDTHSGPHFGFVKSSNYSYAIVGKWHL
jgi:hypothetical protein